MALVTGPAVTKRLSFGVAAMSGGPSGWDLAPESVTPESLAQ